MAPKGTPNQGDHPKFVPTTGHPGKGNQKYTLWCASKKFFE